MCIVHKNIVLFLCICVISFIFVQIISNYHVQFVLFCDTSLAICDILLAEKDLYREGYHMQSYMTPYADQNITQEVANRRLPLDKVVVGWYSNREVHQSVTHSHPYHEYIYMVSGKALYHVDGSRYDLHPGELMLIPPGTVHTGFYDTYDRLIIQIDDAFWQDTLHLTNLPQESAAIPDQLMIFHEGPVHKWGIRGLLEHAAVAAGIGDDHEKELMYRSILTGLTLTIHQIIREDGVGRPESTNSLVALVTTYLQQHFREPDLNVSRLAKYAYVSREHLSRVFKEYTMQSVYSYLTELRMQSCRRDIADGKRILDACLENGFPNYSSFLKTFHKMYGVTPQEYRAQLRSAMKQ